MCERFVGLCFDGSDPFVSVHRGMLELVADLDCQGGKEDRYLHTHLFRGLGDICHPNHYFAIMCKVFFRVKLALQVLQEVRGRRDSWEPRYIYM